MFGLPKPVVAALLVHMSRPLVCLEDIQPHSNSAEFIAAHLINHGDHFFAIAATRLGDDDPTKLYTSGIRIYYQNQKPDMLPAAPDHQTATFRQPTASEFDEYDYTRTANPTRTLVERQLAVLEGGSHACAFASGMAAIAALTRPLEISDHIVAGNDLYGGNVRLLDQVLSCGGISISYVDTTDYCTKCSERSTRFARCTRSRRVESP
jgi:Cys/Met metabolism PLP-dependent enzyme